MKFKWKLLNSHWAKGKGKFLAWKIEVTWWEWRKTELDCLWEGASMVWTVFAVEIQWVVRQFFSIFIIDIVKLWMSSSALNSVGMSAEGHCPVQGFADKWDMEEQETNNSGWEKTFSVIVHLTQELWFLCMPWWWPGSVGLAPST